MYELIHKTALFIHIAIGSMALFIFWLPIIEKKGSPKHKRAGNWFVWGMTAVAISGIIMSSLVFIDPLAIRDPSGTLTTQESLRVVASGRAASPFLFMLSFFVLCATRHSVLVLKAKMEKSRLKTPSHLASIVTLILSGIYVGSMGLEKGNMLFNVFSVLTVLSGMSMLHYIFKAKTKPSEWIIEHIGSILGAGIAAYTAFFVFGGQTVLNDFVPSDMQILFWIMPGVIGGALTRMYTVKYRQRYNIA